MTQSPITSVYCGNNLLIPESHLIFTLHAKIVKLIKYYEKKLLLPLLRTLSVVIVTLIVNLPPI